MKLIPATEAQKLPPEQWLNVYELGLLTGADFYDCCQVKDLDSDDDPSEYGLQLIKERKVIPVGEALK